MTKIEWTDETWNPVVGCTKVSPGCAHCYAEKMAARLKAMALADVEDGRDPGRKQHYVDAIDDKGRWSGKLMPVPEALNDPLHWKKPRRIFVNSMSDLFHESVPDAFVDEVFAVMYQAQWHTYQVLTKRPDRMAKYLNHPGRVNGIATAAYALAARQSPKTVELLTNGDVFDDIACLWPLPWIWLGTSVERQEEADERIPWLLKTPAAVRFLSMEPLLGPVDPFASSCYPACCICGWPWAHAERCTLCKPLINWVIAGGESGHDARPCNVEWIRSIQDQCRAASVPFFVKQLGAFPIDAGSDGVSPENVAALPEYFRVRSVKDKKGGDWSEWPEDLRVREMPEVNRYE